MRISVESKGGFDKTADFLTRVTKFNVTSTLRKFGQAGVDALSRLTPVETGETANSWGYRIKKERGGYVVEWYNTNVNQGAQVAVLIQYGHGTGTGGYVQGIDYINPAMRPIFDSIVNEIWREVQR